MILRTLAYADVFDYPLTAKEIGKYAIAPIQPIKLSEKRRYFYLPGREKIVRLRKAREKWSGKKLKIAKKVATWLKVIPWIKMVGITGALAMQNSPGEDDIDVLIVTAKKRLWLTRFLAVLLIEVLGRRRRPRERTFRDKICLNMFLSEEKLAVPAREQNLYTAHEVAQVRKIWDRGDLYRRFLQANEWVKEYLPNIQISKRSDVQEGSRRWIIGDVLERIARRIQWQYMKNGITKEKISEMRLMFHPNDLSQKTLRRYKKALDKLGATD
jgi:hypothetical protein